MFSVNRWSTNLNHKWTIIKHWLFTNYPLIKHDSPINRTSSDPSITIIHCELSSTSHYLNVDWGLVSNLSPSKFNSPAIYQPCHVFKIHHWWTINQYLSSISQSLSNPWLAVYELSKNQYGIKPQILNCQPLYMLFPGINNLLNHHWLIVNEPSINHYQPLNPPLPKDYWTIHSP